MGSKKLISRRFLRGGILKAQNAIPGGIPVISNEIPEKPGLVQRMYKKLPSSIQDGIEETADKIDRDARLLVGDGVVDFFIPSAEDIQKHGALAWTPMTTVVGNSGQLASEGLRALGFGPATKMEGARGAYIESLNNALVGLDNAVKKRLISSKTYNAAIGRLKDIARNIRQTKTDYQEAIDEVMSTIRGRGRGGTPMSYSPSTRAAAEREAAALAEERRLAQQKAAEEYAARKENALNKEYSKADIGKIFVNEDGTGWFKIVEKDGKIMVRRLNRNVAQGINGRVQARGRTPYGETPVATKHAPEDIMVDEMAAKQSTKAHVNKSSGIKIKDAVPENTVKQVEQAVEEGAKQPKKPLTNAERRRLKRKINGQK